MSQPTPPPPPPTGTPEPAGPAVPAGTMAELVRRADWAATPLGPADRWPPSLRTAVGICLASRFPMMLWWGPELTYIYNDGYAAILGRRHPAALGKSGRDVWADVWPTIGPQVEAVFARGESTWNDRVRLTVERNGFPEDAYFTWSYSPIPDDCGGVGGMLNTCVEETARVRAEAERDRLVASLAAERARLADAFRQSPAFTALLEGPDHVFSMANDRYRELVGDRDVVGKPVREALPEVAGQGFFELLDRVYATGEPFAGRDVRVRVVRRPGRPPEDRYLEFVYQPMRGADGAVTGVFVHGVDLTEHRLAEAAVRESEERFRAAFDQAVLGMVLSDPLGRVVRVNEAFCRIVGRPAADLLGRDSAGYTHPDDVGPNVERVRRVAADGSGGITFEKRYVRPDGRIVWTQVSLSPTRDAGGLPEGMIGVIEDVTDRKATAERLARDATLLANVRDSVIVTDLAGVVTFWNDGATKLFGWSAAAMLGRPYADRLPEPARAEVAAWIGRIAADGGEFEGEWLDYRKDGSTVWIEATTRRIFGADGTPAGIMGVARDITDRKRAEAERARGEAERQALLDREHAARVAAEHASRMKDEFLATLSHELRTPLNAILGWSQIVRRRPDDVETLNEGLATIERNARTQAKLIEDLLDMSRIIAGKVLLDVRPVDVGEVVRAAVDTCRPAADAKGVRVQAAFDPAAGAVPGDAGRLQQVFWNLLSNAVKFTPRGGGVGVGVARVGPHVEVEVADTGEGIETGFLPFVFDRFRQADASTTRRHGGLGLGLAIVKQLVESHGGTVRAHSDGPGRGTTFTVALPVPAAAHRPGGSPGGGPGGGGNGDAAAAGSTAAGFAPGASAVSAVGPGGGPRPGPPLAGLAVVVVDDEPDARGLARRVLEDGGASVRTAASAAEAFALVAAGRPDVLVSDVGMPGEDGYALVRRVRSLPPAAGGDTPALALTAYARTEDRVAAIRAGYQLHLAKPIDPLELVAAVATLGGRSGG